MNVIMGCANWRFEVAMVFDDLGVATIEFNIGVQAFLCVWERETLEVLKNQIHLLGYNTIENK